MTNKSRLTWALIGITALGLMVGLAYLQTVRTEASGKVVLSSSTLDFGLIQMEKGPVSREITVMNAGDADLKINRLSTSCGCTTADMDLSDMTPGESRTMTITFDPQVHPDQTGPIVRVVYLQTSDPEAPETEIDVQGNVTKEMEL